LPYSRCSNAPAIVDKLLADTRAASLASPISFKQQQQHQLQHQQQQQHRSVQMMQNSQEHMQRRSQLQFLQLKDLNLAVIEKSNRDLKCVRCNAASSCQTCSHLPHVRPVFRKGVAGGVTQQANYTAFQRAKAAAAAAHTFVVRGLVLSHDGYAWGAVGGG
jgi:hypothetical protein